MKELQYLNVWMTTQNPPPPKDDDDDDDSDASCGSGNRGCDTGT